MPESEFQILVVDDSALIRSKIREELELGGYRVVEAAHGYQALARAAESPPDLITLDVEMPKLNGFETCRRMREPDYSRFFTRTPNNHVPIIFVTSLDTIEDRKKGFEVGATDFITKPFQEGELLNAVEMILKPPKRLQGLSALVVDDKETARRVVSDCLEREGVRVIEETDGSRAFKMLSRLTGKIDIVITKNRMPQSRGDELCRKIRFELDLLDLPVIMLLDEDDIADLLDFFKFGVTDYLVQPFVKEEFIARLMVHLERARLNKRLRETLEQVERSNWEIMAGIKYARQIQRSLLPNPEKLDKYLPHSFFLWLPRDIVSGDIYYTCLFDDGLLIAVIDCTGHGVPGAFMTMIASSGIGRIVGTDRHHDPADILRRLNRTVKATLHQDSDHAVSDDGLDAAICFISNASQATGRIVTFAGANLPLYYVLNRETHVIKGNRQSVGYKRSNPDYEFTNHQVHIEPGMSLYMSTDGFVDQLGGTKRKRLGSKYFKKLLLEASLEPFDKQQHQLVQSFEEHRGGNMRVDDVTVVGFGFPGMGDK